MAKDYILLNLRQKECLMNRFKLSGLPNIDQFISGGITDILNYNHICERKTDQICFIYGFIFLFSHTEFIQQEIFKSLHCKSQQFHSFKYLCQGCTYMTYLF